MRSIMAACAAVLALTGCSGGDDTTDDADGPDDNDTSVAEPIDDLCSLLPAEDASRIVGVTYAKAEEPAENLMFPLCSYAQAEAEGPFTLTVSAGPGTIDQAVAGLEFAGEVTEEPIDIPGTDEAAVLATNDGDLSVEQVAAAVGRNVFVVTFGGSTEVAVQLMAAAVGQDVPDSSAAPVPDACGLDPQAVEEAVGAAVEPTTEAAEDAWSSCAWETGGGTGATVSIARDAGDLDRYVVEHAFLPDGVAAAPVTVAGADDARMIVDPDAVISTATLLAAVGDVIYEVEVTDPAGQRAPSIATDLLAVTIGSS